MKKLPGLIVLLLITSCLAADSYQKNLSQIGEVNTEAMEKIKGYWILEDSEFVFEYTDQFVCLIDGLRYYLYTRNRAHSRIPYVYTIVKSKKTGRLYFARGQYDQGRLIGSTSRIAFNGNNRLTVYTVNDHNVVYYKAHRVHVEQKNKLK